MVGITVIAGQVRRSHGPSSASSLSGPPGANVAAALVGASAPSDTEGPKHPNHPEASKHPKPGEWDEVTCKGRRFTRKVRTRR